MQPINHITGTQFPSLQVHLQAFKITTVASQHQSSHALCSL